MRQMTVGGGEAELRFVGPQRKLGRRQREVMLLLDQHSVLRSSVAPDALRRLAARGLVRKIGRGLWTKTA
jgi:hypothetical protein